MINELLEFRNLHEILKLRDQGQLYAWNGNSSALPSPKSFDGVTYVALHLVKPDRVLLASVPSWLRSQKRLDLPAERQVFNDHLESLKKSAKNSRITLHSIRGKLAIYYSKKLNKFVVVGANGQQKLLPSVVWLLRAARKGFIDYPSNWKV
jgi:hypothetical protein